MGWSERERREKTIHSLVAVLRLGQGQVFMVRHSPRGVSNAYAIVFSVTTAFFPVLVQRAALCRSATCSSSAKGNTKQRFCEDLDHVLKERQL